MRRLTAHGNILWNAVCLRNWNKNLDKGCPVTPVVEIESNALFLLPFSSASW